MKTGKMRQVFRGVKDFYSVVLIKSARVLKTTESFGSLSFERCIYTYTLTPHKITVASVSYTSMTNKDSKTLYNRRDSLNLLMQHTNIPAICDVDGERVEIVTRTGLRWRTMSKITFTAFSKYIEKAGCRFWKLDCHSKASRWLSAMTVANALSDVSRQSVWIQNVNLQNEVVAAHQI